MDLVDEQIPSHCSPRQPGSFLRHTPSHSEVRPSQCWPPSLVLISHTKAIKFAGPGLTLISPLWRRQSHSDVRRGAWRRAKLPRTTAANRTTILIFFERTFNSSRLASKPMGRSCSSGLSIALVPGLSKYYRWAGQKQLIPTVHFRRGPQPQKETSPREVAHFSQNPGFSPPQSRNKFEQPYLILVFEVESLKTSNGTIYRNVLQNYWRLSGLRRFPVLRLFTPRSGRVMLQLN